MDKDKQEKERSMDQARRFNQQQAQEKHRRQAGKDRGGQQQGGQRQQGQQGQQQAENMGSRQQGGWSDDEMRQQGRMPASERDRDYDPDGDRNNQ